MRDNIVFTNTNTNPNEVLSMSPDAIDIDVLSTKVRETVRSWLTTARDDIDCAMRERFAYYLAQPVSDNISPRCAYYCPDSISSAVARFIKTGTHRNLLNVTTYVATHYHVSCHELLFGMKKPVELFGQIKSFTLLMPTVCNETYRNKIRSCLEANMLKTDSPNYILRERCIEAGTAQGMNYAKIKALIFGSQTQKDVLEQIYAPDFTFQTDKQAPSVANHSVGFDMVLRDCRKYGVAADYLILQDYSEFAVINGRPLSEEQAEWLSLFLCASTSARMKAIAMLTKYQLMNAL